MKSSSNASLLAQFLLILTVLSFAACGPVAGPAQPNAVSEPEPVQPTAAEQLKQDFGIEIVALRHSAAGHMLDFRFRVVDLEKAMPFFREDIKPYVLDQKSGKSLSVPVPAKLGPMRPTGRNPKEGITYWMFFGNPGLVQPGDTVTVVIGDYRLEDLIVE